MPTLTVTTRGQVTFRKDVLQHLGIEPGEKIEVDKLPDGQLLVKPTEQKHSIEGFSGLLAKKGAPKLTIAQIKKITEDAWAGKR